MKIVIAPSTLRAGANRCATVAREAEAAAQRIGGLQSPEGMPVEATAQLHAATAQLRRSAAAAERESQFLVARAQRGLLADGPFGALLGLAGPQLLSPWAMQAAPQKPQKEHRQGGLAGFLQGTGDELAATASGISHGGSTTAGHTVDGDSAGALGPLLRHLGVPGPGDDVPYAGSRRRELDDAAGWAARHPDEFAAAVGKGVIAYDEHAKEAGHDVVGLLSLAVSSTKADGARSALQKAHVDHVLATVRRPGESAAAHTIRRTHAASELARTSATPRDPGAGLLDTPDEAER
jgi:hypothetical protein